MQDLPAVLLPIVAKSSNLSLHLDDLESSVFLAGLLPVFVFSWIQYPMQTFDSVIISPDSADLPLFAFKMYYIIRLLSPAFWGAEPLQNSKSSLIILFILTKAKFSVQNPLTTPE